LIEKLARVGYATKGVVYIIVGALATLAALRVGGKTTDSQGAFKEILAQPLGEVLLGAVAAGLAGYALWRATQGIIDAEGKGGDLKGLAIRAGYCFSGLFHGGLAFSAARLALRQGGGDGDQDKRELTARVMQLPFGPLLVGLFGAGLVAFALYQVYKGLSLKFRKRLEVGMMDGLENDLTRLSGMIGMTARGVVFAIAGVFLIKSAIDYNPNEAVGIADALRALEQGPFGLWLFAAVAIGVAAYGGYMFVEAKYHRIVAR
jgi:Domain of Unknown Function (DUF1206)